MITFNGGHKNTSGRQTGLASSFAEVVREVRFRRRRNAQSTGDRVDLTAWISIRNLPVDEPDQAAYWMRVWANQNVRVKWPVYHFGVSLAPGEHLSQEQWEYVADRMFEVLGLTEHQALLALRPDGNNERLRIVVNRVGLDGRAWKPAWDLVKRQAVAREMERELGLRRVPTRRDRRPRANHSPPERRFTDSFARRIAGAALKDFQQAVCWEDLEARLVPHGLRLEPSGAGVRVTDGRQRTGLAQVDYTLSGPRLADRYGETLRHFRERRKPSRDSV